MAEENRIEAALDAIEWPPFVKRWEWKVDTDSTGERAVWIWVTVSRLEDVEGEGWEAWDAMTNSIRDSLSAKGVDLWPYIRARTEPEPEASRRR